MVAQLVFGSVVVGLTIVLHVVFIVAAYTALRAYGRRRPVAGGPLKWTTLLVLTTLWLMASHSVAVWIWSALYFAVGAFETFEPALYFALVSFTTLGFGDVVLDERWRLLSGMTAASGLLLFGFSTAFLFEVLARLLSDRTRDND
ncbi:MAG: potassium channel family protein [Gammaproteobacteria bacterium]|nr:potassium channel family protein [Gammaproteobacteria bacterium]